MNRSPASSLRHRIVRLARSNPRLTQQQIAAVVGCSAVTVSRHLRAAAARPGAWPLLQSTAAATTAARASLAAHTGADLAGCVFGGFEKRAGAASSHQRSAVVLLRRLSVDASWDVRGRVASNWATPPAVLATLAADRNHLVRAAAVANPVCPAGVRHAASTDPEGLVRISAAKYRLPRWRLIALCHDDDHDVRPKARRRADDPYYR